MKRSLQGRFVKTSYAGEVVQAFLPNPLPSMEDIQWTANLRTKFDKALVCLGRLDAISRILPRPDLFIFTYIHKEALLSSIIEGTQSSLSELILFEQDAYSTNIAKEFDDLTETSNYIKAFDHAIKRLTEGFPLSLRLICEIHEQLLASGRGSQKNPGEFRRSQNWIGGTRPGNAFFVPPPFKNVPELMGQLEDFLHDKFFETPILLKAALAHVQFETIHPFLDGNGRLGRLLITLLLYNDKILSQPILYLSLYFKLHRTRYYELLNIVRYEGDWEVWLDFFAEAVIYSSEQAVNDAHRLLTLFEQDRLKISGLGRVSESVKLVFNTFEKFPIQIAKRVTNITQLTPATVNKSLKELVHLNILRQQGVHNRHRIYVYSKYMDILNEGTELNE
ncbi:MAG: Fic family protein [Vampirovibrionales bacterium]|nr:Fic family protein [Vampirovibrionales bacterium]